MFFYDIGTLILIGLCHVYLYILCIRYHRMSYTIIALLSVLFTALLAIAITVTGYTELNLILLPLFLLAISFIHKQITFLHSLYYVLFSMVTFTVLKTVLLQLAFQLFMISPFNLYSWTGSVISFTVTLTIFVTIIILRKKIEQFSSYIVRSKVYIPTYLLLIMSILFLLILSFPSTSFLSYYHTKYNKESYVAVLIIFLLLMITFIISFQRSKQQLVEEHEKRLHEQLMDYVEKLEEMHDELATFRHDYVNILLSLEDGIRTKNLEQIEHVYREIIKPTSLIINNQELEITKLSRVAIPEIKSILSVKLLSAQQKRLHVSIDIPETIEQLFIPVNSFIRILSILLDNAIEESVQTEEKLLQVALFEMNDCQYFIVQNSSIQQNIDLQTIYEKNKSSKASNRGYGLFSLKRMINQTPNITLETAFDAPIFTQTVIFKNSRL